MSQPAFAIEGSRVWVAGHQGMVGAALVRRLEQERCSAVLTAPRRALDLTRQSEVERWLADARPDVIIVAAAKVGGILANSTRPAAFLYDNLMIAANIINAAAKLKTRKLLFLGSSCIYPRLAPQPIEESALLTGPLEPTNEWYSVAKIAGIKLCQAYRREHGCDFISAMPTNLYGPGDNYHPENSHVIPALMRRAHEAKLAGADCLTVWGSGTPRREFLHVDDCADALVWILKHYSAGEHINVGSGKDIPIADLVCRICDAVGFVGRIEFDASKPDGAPRKLMSDARLRTLGWTPKISLDEGLRQTYQHWLAHGGSDLRREQMI